MNENSVKEKKERKKERRNKTYKHEKVEANEVCIDISPSCRTTCDKTA